VPHELTDLIDRSQFLVGLMAGAFVVAGCRALIWLSPSRRRPRALVGSGLCIGTLLAARPADVSMPHPAALVLGLVTLWFAGMCVGRTSLSFIASLALFVPGALLVAETFVSGAAAFVRPFLIAFVVLGAAAAARWPRWRAAADAGPLLVMLTVAGAYVCVPDTEHAVLVLGVAIALVWTGWPLRFLTLGAAGASAYVGLLAWVIGTDAVGRGGAVVGAAACLGVLAFVPLLERSRTARATLSGSGTTSVLVIVAVQFVLVLVRQRIYHGI